MPITFGVFNRQDDIVNRTHVVTTGVFSGGVGSLAGSNFTTKSDSTEQKSFYANMQYSSETQFSVTYGHIAGSGSTAPSTVAEASGGFTRTKMIYKQLANKCLPDSQNLENDTTGFRFTASVDTTEINTKAVSEDIYAITFDRTRMKDRLNKKNWTLTLSGSNTIGTEVTLHLTDDSQDNDFPVVATPAGPRYNIVSGSDGVVHTKANSKLFGYYFPHIGTMIFDGNEMSTSMGGEPAYANSASVAPIPHTGSGLSPNRNNAAGYKAAADSSHNLSIPNVRSAHNHLKLAKAIQLGSFNQRAEQEKTTVSHYVYAMPREFNYSSNPTFTTGSDSVLIVDEFKGDPQTFITTIALYDQTNVPVALGKVSQPIKKNFSRLATFKVDLDF
jgi:hypothetical protein